MFQSLALVAPAATGRRAILVVGLLMMSIRAVGGQAGWPEETARRTVASADAAWMRGQRDSAYLHYRTVVTRDSSAATRAVYRLALLEAERNRLDTAIALLRDYVRREPADEEGRLTLAKMLSWRGSWDSAIDLYDEILTRDSTYRDAALGKALTLAWASRHAASVASWQRWLRYAPLDTSAALGLARTLSWAGRLSEAEASYKALVTRVGVIEAERGVALVAAWRGDLGRSAALWEGLLKRNARDAESWVGLANVQRWSGQPRAAHASLRRALAIDPTLRDALDATAHVRVDLSGAVEPSRMYVQDSDGNRITATTVSLQSGLLQGARVRLSGTHRAATIGARLATSMVGRGGASWVSSGGRVTSVAEAGITRQAGNPAAASGNARHRVTALLRTDVTLSSWVGGGLSLAQVPFDETTQLIDRGVVTRSMDGDLSLTLTPRVALAVVAGRTALRGGVPNGRWSGSASVRWRGRSGLTFGAMARGMAYDSAVRSDGYFSPTRFSLVEGTMRQVIGGERGWGLVFEGGVGQQAIRRERTDSLLIQLATRGSAVVRFVPSLGYLVEGSVGRSSVASPFSEGRSNYRATSFQLRMRIRTF